MGEKLATIKYDIRYSSLEEAKDKAGKIKDKLQNSDIHVNPILYIHPKTDHYTSIDNIVASPYVVEESFPYSVTEPDKYFKPLDIVKVDEYVIPHIEIASYKHVGIYVGNGLVFNFSKKHQGTRIHS